MELTEKKAKTYEILIQDRIEMYGMKNTICYLIDKGWTKEELIKDSFSEEDINYVFDNPDECYDCI